jgi:hypothetical protein
VPVQKAAAHRDKDTRRRRPAGGDDENDEFVESLLAEGPMEDATTSYEQKQTKVKQRGDINILLCGDPGKRIMFAAGTTDETGVLQEHRRVKCSPMCTS